MYLTIGMARLKKHFILALALTAAILSAIYWMATALLGPEVAVILVGRSDITQTVVASGRVETPQRIDIGSQITSTVEAVPVHEGQRVKAGQLLILLESSEVRAGVVQARAAVLQAQMQLRQLEEVGLPTARQSLTQAQVNLHNIERQFERTKTLHSMDYVGQAQLDDAQHNLALAQSQLQSVQLQVDSLAEQGSEVQRVQSVLAQARAGLQIALARQDKARIEAPVDGILIARNVERGDVVQAGKVLMVLSPDGPTQLVLQIDEKSLAQLQIGQMALGSADAYPSKRFSAKLAYINPGIDPQRGSVEVKLDVAQPPAYLRQDMTVSVEIEVARRTNTLVVPATAIRDSSSNAPWVLSIHEHRIKRQFIDIGARGSGQLEILSGVQAGEYLLASERADLQEGQRVRERLQVVPAHRPL
jgi:HlyD family secretion protein